MSNQSGLTGLIRQKVLYPWRVYGTGMLTYPERRHVFLLKKQIIHTLVERATIQKDREIRIDVRLNLSGILEQNVD